MKTWQLWVILLANGLFALLANLLFYFKVIEPMRFSANKWPLIGLGLMVYSVQAMLIYFLVKKYADLHWLLIPFKAKDWLWGLAIGVLVWLGANIFLALRLPGDIQRLISTRGFERFLPIFLLNSLPGALIEEYLFRYLPVRLAESRRLTRERTLLLFLAVLVFFTATHIPAYLWQYNNPLWSLWSPFTMGAAYFFVYYATRNLAFVTLFHAFYNNSWMLVGRSEIRDYSLVIVASIIWFFWRTSRRNRLL
ncbi:CPBP family glutamic-type intramembrane protease [Persicitalea jodogahamensis]|uniref:CAAX prenyl protease 2/Lysostaphin resistance protein A-like domain-containing protein n=1 Tax=Persicitalea jodogahamensis TaxID=402147 RepID=A0A8J3D594_9BACT|nr:CPBP family glutamic-type intramembrane protease [Persicitalea jodogahamensis]GHB51621.1 hypothetical protein GCM10007390_00220 [Persicitalea jodogahamensis]